MGAGTWVLEEAGGDSAGDVVEKGCVHCSGHWDRLAGQGVVVPAAHRGVGAGAGVAESTAPKRAGRIRREKFMTASGSVGELLESWRRLA